MLSISLPGIWRPKQLIVKAVKALGRVKKLEMSCHSSCSLFPLSPCASMQILQTLGVFIGNTEKNPDWQFFQCNLFLRLKDRLNYQKRSFQFHKFIGCGHKASQSTNCHTTHAHIPMFLRCCCLTVVCPQYSKAKLEYSSYLINPCCTRT